MTETGSKHDDSKDIAQSEKTRVSKQSRISNGLYIVATPIGNLEDLTPRAKRVLENVDYIACEDTRISSKLLNAFLIKKPLIAYHEHSSSKDRERLLNKLQQGETIALISDAGTPLISDPGYKLVAEAQDLKIAVYAIPGAAAVTTALSIAGLPTDRFLFMGFPPNKQQARQKWFDGVSKIQASLVFYESTRRLPECISDAYTVFGNRMAAVCRELTKKFEEVRRDNLLSLMEYYRDNGAPKGEAVVIIGPPENIDDDALLSFDQDKAIKLALKHMSVKSASQFIAELTGKRKKEIYARAIELSNDE
ncbi:16S rRNA (cytidine(1402)-2'-O)-methyltransferase [Kordiimonas sp. SCSIO 12610]|uniref:16S rRNA (cytidine(1402)-2'-O)-methyltransferase n=1 Tax=Kordiimonas sp. SCSIO 12610 TaxID=2829597 RepID=UPI002108BFDC|nr:16S rRNA (cytidine(1402)-2'-O)-methyltransferase [Kordiimonas sp. SCSIO 12610]UTW55483.1 16S rRNA (cytidine(1402)-2'-O)-methyltransferase [Kordiimonas sp. SCSIO 12610]